MIHLTRKEHETTSALVRRFTLRVQGSGVLKEAKAKRFYEKPISRKLRRVAALERVGRSIERKKMRKLGKVK